MYNQKYSSQIIVYKNTYISTPTPTNKKQIKKINYLNLWNKIINILHIKYYIY